MVLLGRANRRRTIFIWENVAGCWCGFGKGADALRYDIVCSNQDYPVSAQEHNKLAEGNRLATQRQGEIAAVLGFQEGSSVADPDH
jgi:hypothetical protein